ncbi:flagellar hook-associated protein FlgK [Blastochloris viridis]|uniref:Flagellar hook-associated protein 1 n=1 Tax=Blastochloris viridis TaxID=1079 RepID=A0A0H5BP27_BLAVI|nr:flagellar hook-associated protein FlgK [Blastochloris viridis]ALK08082.1 Flagellar hook-associated protein 1 [Blastochloris viridis]BAR98658.1 flagellar hook-associated protein FlgK [Blastochloris viridis]CUU44004.1 Flagellar hook-associated protein 1 [Blastochloris viridis]
MSFAAIRSIATSSLMATSVQTALASSNIANADVDGYTRKLATQVSTVTGGAGSGTAITGITSKINKFLVQAVVESLSDASAAEVTATYSDRLQSMFGQTIGGDDSDNGTSLANTLASLETALNNLTATPEGESLQSAAVDTFNWVATQLREVSRGIQDLRAEADGQISSAITEVNASLKEINDLNTEICAAAARGDSTADLEDKRYTALQSVAEKMNVTYFINSSGAMNIYSSTGQALLTSTVHEISYVAAGSVTASTTFNPITVDGVDITASFRSGEISALIEQRDTALPAVQDELDVFASTFIDAINAVHNTGTSLPAPDTLTGTETVDATDSFSATGIVRFAVVNDDGTLVDYSDIDLSSFTTVGDAVAAIDAINGLSASIDADGHVVVTADATGTGVAVNEMTSSVGADGQGLSDYFGLNDLLVGTSAITIGVRSDLKATPGLLSSSTLSSATSLTTGATVLTSGDATVANALYATLTTSQDFAAAGRMGASSTSFASYAADVIADVAAVAANAETAYSAAENVQTNLADSLASQSGVNIDEETARLSELEDLYAAASQILSTLSAMFDALLEAARS